MSLLLKDSEHLYSNTDTEVVQMCIYLVCLPPLPPSPQCFFLGGGVDVLGSSETGFQKHPCFF